MIDLKAVQNMCNKMEVQDFAYVRSKYNIADVVTKVTKQSIFIIAIENSVLDHPMQ